MTRKLDYDKQTKSTRKTLFDEKTRSSVSAVKDGIFKKRWKKTGKEFRWPKMEFLGPGKKLRKRPAL